MESQKFSKALVNINYCYISSVQIDACWYDGLRKVLSQKLEDSHNSCQLHHKRCSIMIRAVQQGDLHQLHCAILTSQAYKIQTKLEGL